MRISAGILLLVFICFANAALPILRDLARGKGKYAGSCVRYSALTGSDKNYSTILGQQYGSVTPENEMKWSATEPSRNQFSYSQADTIVRFAKEHNQVVRGHNLAWGEYNPSWLTNGNFSPTDKQNILKNHIQNVVTHYKGQLYAWDVVNEAVQDNPPNSGNGLKNNVWYPSVSNYIDLAFQYAHDADPGVKLFYNDYSSEGMNSKANYIYNMVKGMKDRGVPIHGVGLQCHFSLQYSPSASDITSNIQRLINLGLEVHITELDIAITGGNGNHAQILQAQGNLYSSIQSICNRFTNCTQFITWGYTDKYTWLETSKEPLPFDQNYNNKPAFDALAKGWQ